MGKPDWDKLMDAFADSETVLIADVDCTTEGKPLCEQFGVKGYPTLKWGDPSNLEDYKGGRDYKSLEKFAKENLKPICSPSNIDLCDDEKKAEIEKKVEEAEAAFKEGVEALQAKYQSMMDEKE